MSYLVCLILMAYSCTLASSETPNNNNDLNIFILAGQSNMAGRGYMKNGVPPECNSNPRIQRLTAQKNWEMAKDPLHVDIDLNKPCGLGPGMSFANSLLKKECNETKMIGLVPCAVGGTFVSQWQKGEFLFKQLLDRAEVASQSGTIRAMLWYQGEAESNCTEEVVKAYKGLTKKFFHDVRTELKLPTLPIIQVSLASGVKPAYTEIIRKAQREIAKEVENVTKVDAMGLPLNSDNLHLNAPAQVQLGTMLADATLPIIKQLL